MKKRYQIDREQAVGKFQEQAKHSEESLQLTPAPQGGGRRLARSVGRLMRRCRVGTHAARHGQRGPAARRRALRTSRAGTTLPLGREQGFLVVDGQKVPIERHAIAGASRVREQRLASYELFRRSGPLDEAVWDKLMLGLSTRNYSKACAHLSRILRYRQVRPRASISCA